MDSSDGDHEQRIAAALLTYLASGGTLAQAKETLPAFESRISAHLGQMLTKAGCSPTEMEIKAKRLRELANLKETAINAMQLETAAELRDEECKLFKSVGVKKGFTRGASGAIREKDLQSQLQDLWKLFNAVSQ